MATRKAIEPERSRQAVPSFAVLVTGRVSDAVAGLCDELAQSGSVYFLDNQRQTLIEQLARQSPDIILVEPDDSPVIRELVDEIKQESPIPIIALVRRETSGVIDSGLAVDDFLISPYDIKELRLRVKRLLGKTYKEEESVIRCGDLVIDLDKCEVSLCGQVIMLTFREYELLKYLAGNPERVFTRETLLNKVWGYDYYGGDRTVDVHIRRLRSKIEDSTHAFIETVRNIGYRFNPAS